MSRRPTHQATSGRGAGRAVPHLDGTRRLRNRCIFVAGLFVLIAGAFTWRLVTLQVLEPDRYLAHGVAQRIRTVTLPAGRGAIVDRNGVDLALSVPRSTVVADPRLVEDPARTARALVGVLDTDYGVLLDRLSSDRSFVYLDRQVDDVVAEEVLGLELPGLYTIQERARERPGDGSALSLLGRTDIDSNGISGLELVYDDLLSGTTGQMVVEVGARGATIPGGDYRIDPAQEGLTLVISIDRSLQFEAERLLADGVEAANAEAGVLVAMRPETGEVLASATVVRDADGVVRPSSDHRAVTWTYEPGSIVKPLTFSAVLETGIGSPSASRPVDNWVNVADADFKDSFAHEEEDWTVADILRQSSNVGTILWAIDLGASRLYDQLVEFGLGSTTGLDFPGEASGILPSLTNWSGTSLPTIAIGQGVATTPMQMLIAYATLANDGLRPAPTMVLGTRDNDGVFEMMPTPTPERVFPAEHAAEIATMMEDVVLSGTGTRAQVPGYRVAGKTGTAWKPHPDGGYGLEQGEVSYVASFAGFLPAEAPELAILVVIDEPTYPTYSGGSAAAPVFAEFAQFAVRQMRVPSEDERVGLEESGRVIAATPAQVQALAEAQAELERLAAGDDEVAGTARG